MAVDGIPVVWMPATNPEDYAKGRFGKPVIAIVHHRAVTNLNGIDVTFAANDTNPATAGAPGRRVSSHFGIGHENGRVEIHQYVDLADTAYCNGDVVADSMWRKVHGTADPNIQSVSIEHEDNGHLPVGTDGRGVVPEDVIAASIALDRVLRSGFDAIRNAGIRIREDTGVAAQLAAVPLDSNHLIDHHYIAGRNKPYCWRPWAQDKTGFPQARYIAELYHGKPTGGLTPADVEAARAEGYADAKAKALAAVEAI